MTLVSPDHGVGIELPRTPAFQAWERRLLATLAEARAEDAKNRRKTMRTMLVLAAFEAAALGWQMSLARPLWVVSAVIAFVLAMHLFVVWLAWNEARKLETGAPL